MRGPLRVWQLRLLGAPHLTCAVPHGPLPRDAGPSRGGGGARDEEAATPLGSDVGPPVVVVASHEDTGASPGPSALSAGPNIIWEGEFLEKFPFSFAGSSKKRWFQVGCHATPRHAPVPHPPPLFLAGSALSDASALSWVTVLCMSVVRWCACVGPGGERARPSSGCREEVQEEATGRGGGSQWGVLGVVQQRPGQGEAAVSEACPCTGHSQGPPHACVAAAGGLPLSPLGPVRCTWSSHAPLATAVCTVGREPSPLSTKEIP